MVCQDHKLHGLFLLLLALADPKDSCHSCRAALFLSRGCKAPGQLWDPLLLFPASLHPCPLSALQGVSVWVCVGTVWADMGGMGGGEVGVPFPQCRWRTRRKEK